MSQLSTYVDCVQVQSDLMEAWNYNNLGHDGAVGLKFVLSPVNRNGFIQGGINHKPNGLKTVQVIYGQRFLESDVSESGQISCDAGGVDGETFADYDLDPTIGASFSLKITPAQLRARCQANPLYMANEVKKMMDAVIEKADTDFLSSLNLNLGNFASDVDAGIPAGTNTFITTSSRNADDVLIEKALQEVRFQFDTNGFTDIPFGFGTRPWYDYVLSKNAACCSQLGVDVAAYAATSAFGFSYSHKMIGILGNNTDAIFMAPKAVQMIHFNEFTGPDGSIDYFNNGGTVIQGTLDYPDATIPLTFDYRAEYVCESSTVRYWKISVALAYEFIYMPSDMYQVGDRKEGVNGINKFRITNP